MPSHHVSPDNEYLTALQELETYRVFTAEQDFKYAAETFLQVGRALVE